MRFPYLVALVIFAAGNQVGVIADLPTNEPVAGIENSRKPATIRVVGELCHCGQMVGGFDAMYEGRSIEVSFVHHSATGRPSVKVYRKNRRIALPKVVELFCGNGYDKVA